MLTFFLCVPNLNTQVYDLDLQCHNAKVGLWCNYGISGAQTRITMGQFKQFGTIVAIHTVKAGIFCTTNTCCEHTMIYRYAISISMSQTPLLAEMTIA